MRKNLLLSDLKKLRRYRVAAGHVCFIILVLHTLLTTGFDGLVELTHRQEFKLFAQKTPLAYVVEIERPYRDEIEAEFEIEGRYFDVVSYRMMTSSTVVYRCVEDHHESHLWEQFAAQQAGLGGPIKTIFSEFFRSMGLVSSLGVAIPHPFVFHLPLSPHWPFCSGTPSPFVELLVPPPQAF